MAYREPSHKTSSIQHPEPYCIQGWFQREQGGALQLEQASNPLPHGTLGDLGIATRVKGPAKFPQTVLIQPFHPSALTGIDPASVRVFRWNKASRSLRPLWNSSVNLQLGFVWARIERPGLYVPVGLPRDGLLRDLLRTLALQRRYADLETPDASKALTLKILAPYLETPREELEGIRQQLTIQEVYAGVGPSTQQDLRFGRVHVLLAFPLPRDESLEIFQERLRKLEPSVEGLPEEQLFSPPGPVSELEPQLQPSSLPHFEELIAPSGGGDGSPDWPMYHHDAQHTGIALLSNITSLTVGRLIPLHDTPLEGIVQSIPSIVANKIYVGTMNKPGGGGTLYKIDLMTGCRKEVLTFRFFLVGYGEQALEDRRPLLEGMCISPLSPARSTVLMPRHLHRYGLPICETLIQHTINQLIILILP